MKLYTCLFIALFFKLSSFAQVAYSVKNLTEKFNYSVFGLVKFNNNWYITTSQKKSNRNTDLYLTDSTLSKFTPFASGLMTDADEGILCLTKDGKTMYYTSLQKNFQLTNNKNEKKLKIAIAESSDSGWKQTKEFPFNSNEYRTAYPTLNHDDKMLIFSSDMPGGKGGMDLYYCISEGNGWSRPINLETINSSSNEIFPNFDKEDNLIFSSDRKESMGGLDLFIAKKNGDNFDNPKQLDTPINSEADDFCLFYDDNMQGGYFSTNRFKKDKDDIVNFKTINTNKQNKKSFSISVADKYTQTPLPYVIVALKNKKGEVIHQGMTELNGKLQIDDIPIGDYTVQGMLNDISTNIIQINETDFISGQAIGKELTHNDPRFTLAGLAINTQTKQPIENVIISCKNISSDKLKEQQTKIDGNFLFQIEQNSNFEIQGKKTGWLSSEVVYQSTQGLDRSAQLYVHVELKIEKPTSKSTITLRRINYDYKKSDIRKDAAIELDRVNQLLIDYPEMTIELSSHTDSRGSDAYNLKLSQERADATKRYLVNQGIASSRLHAKGYGETKLLNNCKNEVPCSEKQHMDNRRTEFTILSCDKCNL